MEKNILTRLEETRYFLQQQTKLVPRIGIILGSGLSGVVDGMKEAVSIPYTEIPHFVASTVEGHPGELVIGRINGIPVMVMRGRLHYYEGYTMEAITYPVRLMKCYGVESLVITAVAGAINREYRCGDIVFIKDHINFMGADPLRRRHYPEFGERFPDMSAVYSRPLRAAARKIARRSGLRMQEGVYLGVRGPSYETPSEIKAFRTMGGDVVGMSVVPEAIVANQMKLRILGIVCVSNPAAGMTKKLLCHADVLKVGSGAEEKLGRLVNDVITQISETKE